ncbi:hypothetical protein CYY_000220 [Polysphondylium violaceum]|uniref:FNIP repeat-containing protein n=1 Tax=Polysphondylium violaceum TaxID=133409 RepID=A0A8J4Q385_9MYCE|nr:hypothetical protein CYY_000220 [Polysphondylium violaceum]
MKRDKETQTSLFFSIFRNNYIKSKIRNNRFRDSVLQFTLSYLNSNNNHVYISKLTNNDKLEYNISIKIVIRHKTQFRQYLASPQREIIDHIVLDSCVDATGPSSPMNGGIDQDGQECSFYYLDLFHNGLKRLEIHFDNEKVTRWCGRLPDTLLELIIHYDIYSNFESDFLDHLVSHLPPNLTRLTLPSKYCMSVECRVPESLTDLNYISEASSLKHLVLPSNRVYKGLTYTINNSDDYEWLTANPWVSSVYLYYTEFDPKFIPDHILSIIIGSPRQHLELVLEKSILPSNLKHLCWNTESGKMNANSLPQSLENFDLYGYDHPLECGVFHNALQILSINSSCPSILRIGVLPPNLTELFMYSYNQPLQAKVLPRGLKKLILSGFNNKLEPNSLPSSLSTLELNQFSGSFESVGPLNNLTKLAIKTIDQSVSNLLKNVYFIELVFSSIKPYATLKHNTSIQEIQCKGQLWSKVDLPVNFLPLSTKKLFTQNINITEKGSIPDGCICLNIDFHIDKSLLPLSVTNVIYCRE